MYSRTECTNVRFKSEKKTATKILKFFEYFSPATKPATTIVQITDCWCIFKASFLMNRWMEILKHSNSTYLLWEIHTHPYQTNFLPQTRGNKEHENFNWIKNDKRMAFHCAFILPKMIGHKFHTNKIITPFSLPIFFTRFTQGVTEKNEINLHNSRFSKKIFQFFPSPLPTKPVFQLVERHDKMIYT